MEQEARCHNCNALLLKYDGEVEIEVICHGCRCINYVGRDDQGLGLRGQDFKAKALDHLCPCGVLQFRSIGIGKMEVKCKRCAELTEYDTLAMRTGRQRIKITDPNFSR